MLKSRLRGPVGSGGVENLSIQIRDSSTLLYYHMKGKNANEMHKMQFRIAGYGNLLYELRKEAHFRTAKAEEADKWRRKHQ